MNSAIARHVVFFIYPGFVLLDLSGPLEAFTLAEALAPNSYRISVISLGGGPIESSTCVKVSSLNVNEIGAIDTFVVVGDFALAHRPVTPEEIDFIRDAWARARRTASVCMGAFLLAASGILDGRRATTHWRYAPKLQTMYPNIRVDGDHIFLEEAGVWTSAGMTAGIDMVVIIASSEPLQMAHSVDDNEKVGVYVNELRNAIEAGRRKGIRMSVEVVPVESLETKN